MEINEVKKLMFLSYLKGMNAGTEESKQIVSGQDITPPDISKDIEDLLSTNSRII